MSQGGPKPFKILTLLKGSQGQKGPWVVPPWLLFPTPLLKKDPLLATPKVLCLEFKTPKHQDRKTRKPDRAGVGVCVGCEQGSKLRKQGRCQEWQTDYRQGRHMWRSL